MKKIGIILCLLLGFSFAIFAEDTNFPKVGEAVRSIFLLEFAPDAEKQDYVSVKATDEGTLVYKHGKEIKDYKALVFSFFNSTCENCKKEIPELIKLYEEYKEKGLHLFVIAVEPVDTATGESWSTEGVERVKQAAKEWGITCEILDDHYFTIAQRYSVQKGSLISVPATFIVDSTGKYVYTHSGYKEEESVAEWKSVLSKIFAEE